MVFPKNLIKECDETSKKLEKTANDISLIYSMSIWLAVLIGIAMIGGLITNNKINFLVGALGLFLTLVPLILKNRIEKIEGYLLLSNKFKNLKQDLTNNSLKKQNLEELKELRKELCKYPLIRFINLSP
jgi:hydrogenase-4 membrane subunit HyfE